MNFITQCKKCQQILCNDCGGVGSTLLGVHHGNKPVYQTCRLCSGKTHVCQEVPSPKNKPPEPHKEQDVMFANTTTPAKAAAAAGVSGKQYLEIVKKQTQSVFDRAGGVKVPEPALHWKQRLDTLEEAGLAKQRTAAIFDMRREQADAIGFVEVNFNDIPHLLMGKPHTDQVARKDLPRETHTWFLEHHTGKILTGADCTWGDNPYDLFRKERAGLWYMPPFSIVEKWRCRRCKIESLDRSTPYSVAVALQVAMQIRLFNAFDVFAPVVGDGEEQSAIQPILFGSIYEIPPRDADKGYQSHQEAYYFLAQW